MARGIARDFHRHDDINECRTRGSSGGDIVDDVRHRDARINEGSSRHAVTFNLEEEYHSAGDARRRDGRSLAGIAGGDGRSGKRGHRQEDGPRREQAGSEHTDSENRERNRLYDNPHATLAVSEFYSYDRQHQRSELISQKSSGKVDYYNRQLGRSGGISSSDFADRIGSSTAAVGGLMGSGSGHGDGGTVRKPHGGKDQIRFMTEERKRSAEACDDHVRSVQSILCLFCWYHTIIYTIVMI